MFVFNIQDNEMLKNKYDVLCRNMEKNIEKQ